MNPQTQEVINTKYFLNTTTEHEFTREEQAENLVYFCGSNL